MGRFLIVDGSSMLVTSYYGLLPKQILFAKTEEEKEAYYDKIMQYKGQYTNAMYTMTKSLRKLEKEQQITHMVICFDTTRDTFRREEYPLYKANRGSTPVPLKQQFINMENMLREIGYAVETSDSYEADDLAGSAAFMYESRMPTYIITKDHDYLQLISENTFLWLIQTKQEAADDITKRYASAFCDQTKFNLPDKAALITPEICRAEYGVDPSMIPDLKGIVGDSSDNIPGVKGVSSAAAPLLKEYGSIDGVYEAIDSCKNDKEIKALSSFWKEALGIKRTPVNALIRDRNMAFLSRRLATIKRDVPLSHSFEQMSLDRLSEGKRVEQYKKYGFKTI